jgi:hypothetical protein
MKIKFSPPSQKKCKTKRDNFLFFEFFYRIESLFDHKFLQKFCHQKVTLNFAKRLYIRSEDNLDKNCFVRSENILKSSQKKF